MWEQMLALIFLCAFELMIDSILLYNIFVIMSEALFSDKQVDLIRSVIAKDKKQQLARTKESYRKLKKDRVKDILNNPSGINDEKAKKDHKEAVKYILNQNFEDGIVTASYDQKIIGLCEKQRKDNSAEVRLSLSMLYRKDEMEEKLNDQERIRSGQKSKQMGESRKSLGSIQESRKDVMLMSPSPAKEKIGSKNEESYPQSSAQIGKISHQNQDERQSSDRVQQSSSSNLGKDFFVVEQNEPNSQQDASLNSSIMNSPTFLPYNHSEHRLRDNSSKQEKQFSYPQLSPPAIDSVEQNQTSQEVKTCLPQPKIQEIFENLQVKTGVVPQSSLPEPQIEQFQRPEKVASSTSAVCETESVVEQVLKIEQEIVDQSPKVIAVQQKALLPQNAKQSQPQSQDNKADAFPVIKPESKAVRLEAVQFHLIEQRLIENISISDLSDESIKFIYEIIPGSAEGVSASAQITGIEANEDNYEIIQ